jgi:hypothetical protein
MKPRNRQSHAANYQVTHPTEFPAPTGAVVGREPALDSGVAAPRVDDATRGSRHPWNGLFGRAAPAGRVRDGQDGRNEPPADPRGIRTTPFEANAKLQVTASDRISGTHNPNQRVSARPPDPTTPHLLRAHQPVPPSGLNHPDNSQPNTGEVSFDASAPRPHAISTSRNDHARTPERVSGTRRIRTRAPGTNQWSQKPAR